MALYVMFMLITISQSHGYIFYYMVDIHFDTHYITLNSNKSSIGAYRSLVYLAFDFQCLLTTLQQMFDLP